ncbi:fungal-specific transcription factor domain-containing protein, partial [Scheffersomyces coipomensis]|uniref:fungal-specific transcription factor domain-containing protein n=1 Tax=Scheffersomyces coipomensis TaxID=1788519 RepID=UPI00315D89E5
MPPKKRKLATSDLKSEAADGLTTPTSSTISTPTSASTSNGGALSASAISLPPSNNNSNPSSIVGISRSISACQRCRAKKIKCDQRFPKCSKCEKHGVECIGLDPLTGREVPRSYIVHLEERIKFLESKLKANGIVVEDSLETLEPSHTNDDLNKQQLHQQHDDIDNDRKKTTIKGSIKLEPLDGPSTISFSRLMSTAFRVQKKSLTNIQNPIASRKNGTNNSVSSMNNNINSNLLPAILPPKITALQFISIFFAQSNSQLPILHREEFIKKYFIPIYGKFDDPQISLANDYSKINFNYFENDNNHTTSNSSSDRCWFEKYKDEFQSLLGSNHNNQNISNDEIKSISNSIIPPKKYRKGLYFLNLIFAIASSVNHLQYPITISDSFRLAANKHFDEVYSSPDQLESLSGILLYSLYSTMRPTNPGVWYILGSALRMCVDLDLHNELNTNTANHVDSFTKDKRRRLFWCTYCVDRQICFYLDRPVGIPDESINTPFLSELDDSFIVPNNPAITDYSTITNDVPTYKVIFLSIIKIRQIQSEVQRVLYTNYPLSGKYKTIADWKSLMLVKLASWKSVCPSSPKQMNCNFNLEFFRLNYHHTLLMLHGLSPKNYKLASKDYIQVFKSAQEVMDCYSKLCQTKSINYTWAAVHNLFMAGTSYLYSIYNSEDVRQLTSLMEMKRVTSECLNVLNSLVDRCDAATNCIEIFQNLT